MARTRCRRTKPNIYTIITFARLVLRLWPLLFPVVFTIPVCINFNIMLLKRLNLISNFVILMLRSNSLFATQVNQTCATMKIDIRIEIKYLFDFGSPISPIKTQFHLQKCVIQHLEFCTYENNND